MVLILIILACVAVLAVLLAMRSRGALQGDIPKPVAAGIVLVLVVLAAFVVNRLSDRRLAGSGEEPPPLSMGGGMGGGGGMAAGGMGAPDPHRDLGTLVRKLGTLVSEDPEILTEDQIESLLPTLKQLQATQGMTVEEAEAARAELESVLGDELVAAVEAVEFPPRGGGMAPGAPGGGGGMAPLLPPPTGVAPGVPGSLTPPPTDGDGPGGAPITGPQPDDVDRFAAMRERMLEDPYIKTLYDEAVAADPAVLTDSAKRDEFFRGLRQRLSPFRRGPSENALNGLIGMLEPGTE